MTADTIQSKVFIVILAAEVQHNCGLFRAGMSGARTAQFATVGARRKAHVRGLPKEWEQVGNASRVVRVRGHE
jgi:hypothetical protein